MRLHSNLSDSTETHDTQIMQAQFFLAAGTPSFGVLVSDRHGGSFGSRRVIFGAGVSFGSGGGQFRGAGGGDVARF